MQFIALGTLFLLEQDKKRLPVLRGKIDRRSQETVLDMQLAAGFCGCLPGDITADVDLLFFPAANIVKHGTELVWRKIAIEAGNQTTTLVEEKQRGRVLYVESPRKIFLCGQFAIKVGHFTISPHVDGNDIEILLRLPCNGSVAEVVLEQLFAIGTAVLVKIEHESPVLSGGFLNVFPDIKKRLFEPGRLGVIAGIDKAGFEFTLRSCHQGCGRE